MIEPLVLIGVGLFVVLIIHKYKNIYLSKIFYFVLFFFLLVTTPLGANFIVARVESNVVDTSCINTNVDAVVILSGGITGDPNSIDEIWRLKESTYRRTMLGLELAKRTKSNYIIVSGGYGGLHTEANIMANLIKKIGFTGNVIVDRNAKTTHASSLNVVKILKGLKISDYWLVTSAVHMPRAKATFKQTGMNLCRYSVDSQYLVSAFPGNLLPQITALDKSTAAFHEIIGYFWYKISGKF